MRAFTRIGKLHIEGAIDLQLQEKILYQISKIRNSSSLTSYDALSVIINSYGGPITSAKNISNALKTLRQQKQMPIYCFAEDFCLNSANLILTLGNRAYASKFTIMGEIGYVYEGVDDTDFLKNNGFGIDKIQNSSRKYPSTSLAFNGGISLKSENKIEEFLKKSLLELTEGIKQNRRNRLVALGVLLKKLQGNPQEVINKMISQDSIDPVDATENGLIDEVTNFDAVRQRDFCRAKIKVVNPKLLSNPLLSLFHQWIQQKRRAF